MKSIKFTCAFLLAFSSINAQTWNQDIATIVYNKCGKCHHEGGIAPDSFLAYADAFEFSGEMLEEIEAGNMPPWPANENYTHFIGENNLTQEETQLITNWVNSGAPEGSGSAPTIPSYQDGFLISSPDEIIGIPEYQVSVDDDVYRTFVIPSTSNVERNIGSIEFDPENDDIVHHILAFYDPSNVSQQFDDADPLPGFASNGGSFPSEDAVLIGVWVPGMGPTFFPENLAIPLPAGADFVFEVHYAPGSVGQQADVKMRVLYKDDAVIRTVYHSPLLYHSAPSLQEPALFIPANTVQTFHEESAVAPFALSLLSVFPHMHLLGKTFKVYGLTPQEDTIRVIDVDNYSFHWQFSYVFPTLRKLPFGSVLYGEATFDNTDANDENPNNPIIDVGLGENTTDEMMICFFMYTAYLPGDEEISMVQVNEIKPTSSQNLFVYPNPAKDILIADIPNNVHKVNSVTLINVQGQTIQADFNYTNGRMFVETQSLSQGIYQLLIQADKEVYQARFLKD